MVDFVTVVSGVLIVFLIFLIILGFAGVIPVIVESAECNMPQHVCNFGRLIGFPEAWLRYDKFLWYGLIPILGMTLIVYGFLSRLGIFGYGRTKLYLIISFVIAFSTIPMGAFVIIVATMFAIMGMYATGVFVGLFIFGIILYAVSVARGWRGEFGGEAKFIEREMFLKEVESKRKALDTWKKIEENYRKKIEEIAKKEDLPIEKKKRLIRRYSQEMQEAEKQIKGIEEEVRELQEEMKEEKKIVKKTK